MTLKCELWILCLLCTLAYSETLNIDGSFRKDYYLPYSQYPEYNQPDPKSGGRLHLIATVTLHAPLTLLELNGVNIQNLTAPPYDLSQIDWARYIYDHNHQQLWISLHTRNDNFAKSITVLVADSAGQRLTGVYVPQLSPVLLTWVTPVSEQTWIFHIHNEHPTSTFEVRSILLDGRAVPLIGAQVYPLKIAPKTRVVALCSVPTIKARGQLFTARIVYGITGDIHNFTVAYGGKTPGQRFQIESWPTSSDCPLPGLNDNAWTILKLQGIDTIFYARGHFHSVCNISLESYVALGKLRQQGGHLWTDLDGAKALHTADHDLIEAVLLADENDGDIGPGLRTTLTKALEVQHSLPDLLSYQGAKTNRHNGVFAGMTDIQGIDFYVAACAPTIIGVMAVMPLQGAYAYLRNARNNHMPLQSIGYSQLYSHAWPYQATGPEIAVQLASVVLAGGKGLSLFQSTIGFIKANSGAWHGLLRDVFLSIVALGEIIRTGDVQGLVFKSSDGGDPFYSTRSLVEVIRNHEWVLIVAVNTRASGYSSLLCKIGISKFWKFQDHSIQRLEVALSHDAIIPANQKLIEVVAGKQVEPHGVRYKILDHLLLLEDIQLPNSSPVRFFLIRYDLH